jgi:ankyrin repeat protein
VKFQLNFSARLLFVVATFFFSPLISAQSGQDQEMLAAAKAGDSERARVLLDGASNINLSEADGMNALHYATLNNDAALVRSLVRAGADINARTRYGITPIYLAARNGSAELTQTLLDADANANEVFNEGETVLMTAARTGDINTVKVLLDAGAIVDAREDWHGQTSLMWAAAQKHPEVIALLVEHGADIRATSALEEWERQITMEPRDKWLPPGVMTPLHFAAREGCLECISTLLDLGAEIDAVTPKDITPLLMAIINGHYDIAWALIEGGADIHISDDTNRSPLYAAVHFNIMPESNRPSPYVIPNEHTAFELMQNLLARGADVNQQLTKLIPFRLKLDRGTDSMLVAGTTAFLRAAKSADIAAMKLLLEYDADPFLSTRQGINPLMTAANHGTKESDTTGRYKTATEMNEAIQICLDQGLDINAKDNMGRTAVFGAATFGLTEVVKYLHEKGAIVNYKDNSGISPLEAAMGQAGGYGFVGRDGVFHENTVALFQNLLD